MTKINASRIRMEEIELFGVPALFTPEKVSRTTVHLGLFCYEIQAPAPQESGLFRLVDEAPGAECFYGTVLTPVPMELPDGGRHIGTNDLLTGLSAGHFTPAEFEEKYFSPNYSPQRRGESYGKDD